MEQLAKRPDWIAGFVDGEGCFQVTITKREKMKFGIEIQLSFSVAQNQKSAHLVNSFKQFWKCGTLKNDTRSNCRVYTVKNFD